MSHALILISFFYSLASFATIKDKIVGLRDQVKEAYRCIPKIENNQHILCTGVILDTKYIDALKKRDLKYCHTLIAQKGYKEFHEGEKLPKELNAIWDSFYKTTKNAETLHKERLVFFKKSVSPINCFHELIHVLQQDSTNSSLAPKTREKHHEEMVQLLSSAANEVEQFEKQGEIEKAKEYGKVVQVGINTLQAYDGLSETLDETEIYLFLLRFCQNHRCGKGDLETTIANLYKYKDFIPWKVRDEVVSLAVTTLGEKESNAYKKLAFKPLSKKDRLLFKKMINQSSEELIKNATERGISIFSLKSPFENSCNENDKLPATLINSLPDITPEIGQLFSNYSKIFSGAALGKYLCNKSLRTIILTQKSCRGTLIHEIMHDLQRKNNPLFCSSLTEQESIQNDFKNGKITRGQYEETILNHKGRLFYAEEEIYRLFLEEGPFENINDYAMNLIYRAKLSFQKLESITFNNIAPIELPLIIENSLPSIYLKDFDINAIFDLGAMRSVIPPQRVFPRRKNSVFTPSRIITLQKSDNSIVEAPYGSFTTPVTIGNTPIKNLRFAIANLKLPGIDTILGMDLFHLFDLEILPHEMKIILHQNLKRPANTLALQTDWNGSISSIEMICDEGKIVRVDTGSQVEVDLYSNIKIKCGTNEISSTTTLLGAKTIFDRDVVANVGWSWLLKFKRVLISPKDKWISIE